MQFVKNNINLENVKLKKKLYLITLLLSSFLTKFYDPYPVRKTTLLFRENISNDILKPIQ